jgi:beta-lactamase regulating signal transducer with metallopeptidase domain
MNPEKLLPLLLDLGLKSAVVVLAALLANLLWRRASAANRHVVWLTALATLLLLPLTELTNPHWTYFWRKPAQPQSAITTFPPTVSRMEAPAFPARAPVAAKSEYPRSTPIRWAALGVAAWMSGMAFLLLHRVAVSWKLGRLMHRSRQTSDERLLALARESAGESGAPWELRESESCRAPLVFGMRRPVILLPAEARDWTHARLSAVLLHEFGHVRGHDCLTRLLMDFACALYWINPLIWIASRKLRIAQEQACDDLVLSAGVSATDYASQILELVRSLASDRFAARHALAMAQQSTLETRVLAILDARRDRRPLTRFALAGGWLAIPAALALCGAAQLRGADEKAAASQAPPITSEDAGNKTPVASDAKAPVPESAARAKAEKIVLPKVEFRDTSVADAVDFLNRKSVELDPAHGGVNIVLKAATEIDKAAITVSLSKIPVYEALQYIAKLSELEISDGPDAIFLYPAGRGAGRIAILAPGSPEAMFKDRADKLIIPHIHFEEAGVIEAVRFLRATIAEAAPDAQGVNIVVKDFKQGNGPSITLDLRNIPLTEAVRYITELAGLDLDVSANAFYLHPHQP